MRPGNHGRRGISILVVTWTILMLATLLFGLLQFVDQTLDEGTSQNRAFAARQMAESGLAVARHPEVEPEDPLLTQSSAHGDTFEVRLINEGARLNIAAILAGERREVLLNLFTDWGLSLLEAEIATDSLLDWVDGDDLPRLHGAENEYYRAIGRPYDPPNRPLRSVREMAWVRGMDAVAEVNPDWQEAFTIYGNTALSANDASADLLRAVTGLPTDVVESFIEIREARQDETGEFLRFDNMQHVEVLLGLTGADRERLAPLLDLGGSVWRIQSTGVSEGFETRIDVVVDRSNDRILFREENQ